MKNINYSINRRSFNAAMILPIIQRRALLRTVLITTLLIPFSIVSANPQIHTEVQLLLQTSDKF